MMMDVVADKMIKRESDGGESDEEVRIRQLERELEFVWSFYVFFKSISCGFSGS